MSVHVRAGVACLLVRCLGALCLFLSPGSSVSGVQACGAYRLLCVQYSTIRQTLQYSCMYMTLPTYTHVCVFLFFVLARFGRGPTVCMEHGNLRALSEAGSGPCTLSIYVQYEWASERSDATLSTLCTLLHCIVLFPSSTKNRSIHSTDRQRHFHELTAQLLDVLTSSCSRFPPAAGCLTLLPLHGSPRRTVLLYVLNILCGVQAL